jgi:hypothetical protein
LSTAVKRNTSYAVEIETTEGTYVAPSASTSFVQTLDSGADISPAKQLLERKIFTGSIGRTAPRTGEFQVAATVPTEARASSTEGAAPEVDKLMQSALGTKHVIATTTTTKTGNTSTVLQIQDADISKFQVGDIVMVKVAGAYHVSPIISKVTTTGSATVTLLVAHPSGSIPDSSIISKSTTYNVADTGHPSLSISKYIESAKLEQAVGCKVKDLALDNFATGQLPSFKFGLEGLNFGSSMTAPPYSPAYDSSVPPIILDGRIYMSGTAFDVNKLTVTLTNTLAFQTSIAAANGRISSRVTDRVIKGTFDPYKSGSDVANFNIYAANTAFSLFAYAKVPSGVAGQFSQVVALYMPNCLMTDFAEADQNGLLQDSITFSANRGNSGTTPEIYIGFI